MLSKIIYSDSRAILEITSRCNFACKYCYCLWHEKGYPISEELTTDEWIEVLHILKKSGVKSVSLTGGEPLLKEGFWQILEESTILFGARNTSFYSNASLLSKDSLVRIKELGVTFATSLQGLSTAEEITGRKDSFKHTLKTIEMASDLGICVFCGCTATSINKNEIVDMLSAVSYAGADVVRCSVLLMGGRALQNKYLSISKEEWESIKNQVRELPINCEITEEFECSCNNQMESENCNAGKTYFVVDPFGNVRKCLHSSFIFGNIFNLKKEY